MRRLCLLAVLLLGPAFAAPATQDDGFVPLFNGRDLSGWVNVNCAPGTFFVKGGEIVTTGKPTGFLRTERQYENFICEFEWMHVNTTAVGNSGFFVWADPLPAVGTPFTRAVEVQVLVNLEREGNYTSHGDVFSIHGATCKPDRPHPQGWARCLPSERRAKGGGEWNHYRIVANDGVIKLHVNGKEVSGVSAVRPRKGYLTLESEGAECHFRNLRIKELPSTNPKPEETAATAEGFTNLFFGDLTGWKADPEQKDQWQPRDWALRAAGESGKRSLWTEKEFGDFELIADWRVLGKGDAAAKTLCGLVVRGESGGELMVRQGGIALQGPRSGISVGETVEGLKPAGQWNRYRVRLEENRFMGSLNGRPLFRQQDKPLFGLAARGAIALRVEGGPAEFANVFIRELKK
jgi:hypothetical protein